MAVPAHDERDFAFAQRFGLPIVEVISPDGKPHEQLDAAYHRRRHRRAIGRLFDGLPSPEVEDARSPTAHRDRGSARGA